jgi:hypothetical protein
MLIPQWAKVGQIEKRKKEKATKAIKAMPHHSIAEFYRIASLIVGVLLPDPKFCVSKRFYD